MASDSRLFVFGPGEIWAELTQFTDGSVPAIVQSFKFDVDQDITIDFSITPKELWGQLIFPVAIGLGEGKVTGKIRQGRVNSLMTEAMLVGQPGQPATGIKLMFPQDFLTTIPATPYQITITPPGGGVFVRDWGVRYGDSGLFLTKVASAPVTGQYSVAAGVYTFAAADTTRQVLISYEYSLTTGTTITYSNVLQGQVAFAHLRYQGTYGGRYIGVDLPNIVGNKFMITTKQKDWVLPEYDFGLFANPAGIVAYLYETE